jgi:ubiquinone/menaquinone biosynthesis C-methylase UbiE
MVAPEILDYYSKGQEQQRLTASLGRLEWLRTWEILQRSMPPTPARLLDVGGGTGVYALPLASQGHRVHLVDPVPRHVARALELSSKSDAPLASAVVGDARALEVPDASFDVLLLLGPLYHLTDRNDRVKALAEARRALVPGGLLVSAYISRFASACDGTRRVLFGTRRLRRSSTAISKMGSIGIQRTARSGSPRPTSIALRRFDPRWKKRASSATVSSLSKVRAG